MFVENDVFLVAKIHGAKAIITPDAIFAEIQIERAVTLGAVKTVRTRIHPETFVAILRLVQIRAVNAILCIAGSNGVCDVLGIIPVKGQIAILERSEVVRVVAILAIHNR